MEENEVEISNGNDLIKVNVDQLPEIISRQIDAISELENKVNACDASAKTAMDFVNGQMTRYEEKGKWIFKHRSGNTKDIIEDTQEAVDNLANAQQVTAEALKQSFEFQKKLAEVSKYLFELGCANITVNRISVRAIEAKLNGASKKDISELAKQEMMAVVKQLKEQEDILKKQEQLNAKVKSNKERLDNKDLVDAEQSKQLVGILARLTDKDNLDAEQSKQLGDILARLMDKDNLDAEQSKQLGDILARLMDKDSLDAEQSKQLSEILGRLTDKDSLDAEQSKQLSEILGRLTDKDSLDAEQSELIKRLETTILEQNDKISKLEGFVLSFSGANIKGALILGIISIMLSICSIILHFINI